jgi:HD-GYP domain-containing protein (c-di-GMP phosphodiesterase class II)
MGTRIETLVETGYGLRMPDIVSALSFALDLTEGQPMGHSVNSCLIGMRLARILGLPQQDQQDLFYALLLKDAGCSSNASRMFEIFGGDDLKAKREVKTTDWSRTTFEGLQYLLRNVMPGKSTLERILTMANIVKNRDSQTQELIETRCTRGATIARRLGLSERTAQAIHSLDEHWNGKGYPEGRRGEEIPLFARIMSLCQTIEVFTALNGAYDAFRVIEQRSGTWFDPNLVHAALPLEKEEALWKSILDGAARERILAIEMEGNSITIEDDVVDNVCDAFAEIIDVKSPFTHRHSRGVTHVALLVAERIGVPAKEIPVLRRAALLHDIGKLSVPNSILDKPGKLTAQEWETVRLHPYYTQRILERISGFHHLAFIASAHHEKLDGSGYFRNLRGTQLPPAARALTIADMYDALAAKRPYRDGLPMGKVIEIIGREVPHALDESCFLALKDLITSGVLPASNF